MTVIAGGFFPLNQTATVYTNVGDDAWGIPVKTPTPKSYKVRLEFNSQARLIQTQGDDGKEVVFVATIFFKGAVPIQYTDTIEYDSGVHGLVKAQPRNISAMVDMSGKVVYTRVII